MMGGVMVRTSARWWRRPTVLLTAILFATLLLTPAVTFAQPSPTIAAGVVFDPAAGTRVQGATVAAWWLDEDFGEYLWAGGATTDGDGAYTIYDEIGYGAREYDVIVRAYGYVAQTWTGYWDGVTPLERDFGLVAAQPLASGKVVTGAAAPIPVPGATVQAYLLDNEWGGLFPAGEAVTDVEGTYTLYDEWELGAGDYEFVAEAEGYQPVQRDMYWSGGSPLALDFLMLPLERLFYGTVFDGRDPLPGARVQAWWVLPDLGERYLAGDAISRADGTYDIYGEGAYEPGSYELEVSADGFVPEVRTGLSWSGKAPTLANFNLFRPALLAEGAAADAGTGERIAGARVTAYHYLGPDEWEPIDSAVSDEEGLFQVYDRLGAGSGGYKFVVEANGYVSWEGVDEWGGGAPLHLEAALDRVPAIATGKVVDADTLMPVVGARVEATWVPPTGAASKSAGDAYADENGVFEVYDTLGLGMGHYEFRATALGYLADIRSGDWAGGEPLVLDIRLQRRPPVATGLVSDVETGQGIAGAEVTAYWIDAETSEYLLSGVTTSTPDGTYLVYDVYERHEESQQELSEFRFEVRAEGYYTGAEVGHWDGLESLPVDLALYPIPPIARGMVDQAHVPIPLEGARIDAEWHDDTGEYLWAGDAYSADDGTYALYDEMARGGGEYRFSCTAEGYYTAWRSGDWYIEEALRIDFRLDPVLPIARGTVRDGSTSELLEGATVHAYFQDPADPRGQLLMTIRRTANNTLYYCLSVSNEEEMNGQRFSIYISRTCQYGNGK